MEHAATARAWSDAELLTHMLDRRHGAWVEFMRRFDPLIMSCLRKLLRQFASVLASTDIDDVHASLLSRLYGNDMRPLRAYQQGRGVRLSTWLGLLTRNAAYDFLRARAQERRLYQAATEGELFEPSTATPESLLEAQQDWDELRAQLEHLTERDRTFVRLCYLERREPREIARAMSITMATVYSKRHKVKHRLKSALQGHAAVLEC